MKPTTLPDKWAALAAAEGGVAKLAETLGISNMTLWRAAHGKLRTSPELAKRLEELATRHRMPAPVKPPKLHPNKDLTMLEMIGDGLAKGWKPPVRSLEHARQLYPESQLLELAESEKTPENVLRAVTLLLS